MLSIIIPIYNAEKTIIKLLDSICKANREDYEVICVNDGSTDKTELLIKQYSLRHKNVKVISQINSGPSKARNTGIAVAKGNYITFADSDDTYITDNLEKVFKIIEDNNDISLFVFDYIETNGTSIKNLGLNKDRIFDTSRYLESAYSFVGDLYVHALWNKIYKKDLLESIGGLDNNIRLGEDAVCNLRCLQKIKKIYVSSIPIYNYKIFDESLSHSSKQFSVLYGCYRNIIDNLKELKKKREFNINIEAVIQNYYLGIINAYITSEYIKMDDKVRLRECLKQLRDNYNCNDTVKFNGFNKLIYLSVKCKFYSIAILLCDIQRIRKRK